MSFPTEPQKGKWAVWLQTFPQGWSLILLFGFICVLLLALGGLSIVNLRALQRLDDTESSSAAQGSTRLEQVAANLDSQQSELLRHIATNDTGEMNNREQAIAQLRATNDRSLEKYEQSVSRSSLKEKYAKVLATRQTFVAATDRILSLSRELKNREAALFALQVQVPAYHAYQAALSDLSGLHQKSEKQDVESAKRRIEQARELSEGLIAFGIVAVAGTGVWVARVLRRLRHDQMISRKEIAERDEAEAARIREEQKSISVFESIPDGIFQSTLEGRLMFANSQMAQLFGFDSPEELIAARNDPARQPDPLKRREIQRRVQKGGDVLRNYEYEIERKDGRAIWVSEDMRLLRDSAGKELYYVGTVRDISERKKAHEELNRVARRFQSFLQATSQILWQVSPVGSIIDDSPTWRAYSGQTQAEMMNYGWSTCIHPEDKKRLLTWVKGFLGTKESSEIEARLRRTDGVFRTFYIRVVPVFNPNGSIREWIGANIDITERKEATERIAEQAALIDQAYDAIMVRDLRGKITFWNEGAVRLYRYSAAEALGQDNRKLLYADSSGAKFLAAESETLERGEWCGEMQQIAKDGSKVIAEVRWTLLRDQKGNPKSFLCINNNITDRKKIEEQFLHAQRLESVGTLAGGVAHDLNNVLAPITMAAPMLRSTTDPAERAKFIDVIEANATRGAEIIKQVLTFARGAGGDRILLQPIHLVEDISNIINQTFPKSIQLQTTIDDTTRSLEADPTQIHQILLNLCINARDAMPDGGKLSLSVKNFYVDETKARNTPGATPGPHVVWEVADTGVGISKETLGKIFDPFFTTKDVGKGTGLGLSTVAGLVKSHGGFLTVHSVPGQTSFKVFLPASVCEDYATTGAVQEAPPLGHGETILLVDDEASIRQVAQLILQDNGYKALVAADGASALDLVAQQPGKISVVITDLSMPSMDGIALMRTLRGVDRNLKIIISTGRTDSLEPGITQMFPADDYLTKPYTTRSLLFKLDEVLRQPAHAAA